MKRKYIYIIAGCALLFFLCRTGKKDLTDKQTEKEEAKEGSEKAKEETNYNENNEAKEIEDVEDVKDVDNIVKNDNYNNVTHDTRADLMDYQTNEISDLLNENIVISYVL